MVPAIFIPKMIWAPSLHVYWGDNQAETRPVHFGMINDWRLKKGSRMIVIDPRKTVTASKADWHIPIRPGGDMALALAVIHYIFEKTCMTKCFARRGCLVKNGKVLSSKGLHASMGSQICRYKC